MIKKKYDTNTSNPDVLSNELMADLGMDDFLEPRSRCDINLSPYTEAANGWKNGILFYIFNVVYIHSSMFPLLWLCIKSAI